MRDGRFHPSKYRDKLQKMEVLYIHFSEMPGPSSNVLKKLEKKFKIKKIGKKEASP
jgi:hypothetical protein